MHVDGCFCGLDKDQKQDQVSVQNVVAKVLM